MRTSQYFISTLKETPADAELVSHQLMMRAGLIRKLGSGLYTWMPIGMRVLQNVSQIVREEMNRIGAMELQMPCVQPAELWQESGRWGDYGPLLLKIKDRHKNEFCFGPTHEEIITDVMRNELQSYKQLPITFYQIQTKFRDEIRPRYGVMRAREFLMKDAYSFHVDKASLEKTYQDMHGAYCQVFSRIGLDFRPVQADTGSIGGSTSHEFQVLAKSGEDLIAFSDGSDYAANIEEAKALPPTEARPAPSADMKLVDTPKAHTIKELVDNYGLDITKTIKTLIVKGTDTQFVALILRGDHELNELKAEKHPAVQAPLEFADEQDVKKALGAGFGSLGVVEMPWPIIADHSALNISDFGCGANIPDQHYFNVNWERDVALPEAFDLRTIQEGDVSPCGKGKIVIKNGIEVGHIFQLGDKYSKAMNASVLDENGKSVTMQMGCYGIGVSRIVAAAIEQSHDDKGIIWPESIAPFKVMLVPVNVHKSEMVRKQADELYQQLQDLDIEVLFEDRNERLGVLLNDSELLGIPHRILIGERGLKNNVVEYKARASEEAQEVAVGDIFEFIKNKLQGK